MKNRIWAWVVLGIITVVAGLGLALTNEVTKGPIQQQAIAAEEKAKQLVMPEAASFVALELEDENQLFEARNDQGEVIGYVGKAESKGYAGLIEVVAGVREDGTITGINVGGASFAETPGLGSKAREEGFTAQFAGKTSPVRLGDASKDNEVDAITAATRTSNAVLGAVNAVAYQVNVYLHPELALPEGPAEGTSYAGEANGFAGPVYVVVTVRDDGTISALKVGDERFGETDGYGAAALEPAFTRQFKDKGLPLSLEDIDGIGGATVTTRAVVDAVNQAYESQNILLPEGTTYAGEAQGFAGAVYVEVTIKDDQTITALKVGDERFGETDGYGAAALEPAFAGQFLGKAVPMELADVDGISGATLTTQAVVSAINSAYESQNIIAQGAAPKPTAEPTAAPEPVAVPEDAQTLAHDGYAGPVAVTASFDEQGRIAFLQVGDDRFQETRGFGQAALEEDFQNQFLGKLPPLTERKADEAETDSTIDGISGATITTKAVLDAVNEMHAAKFGAPQPEPTPDISAEADGITATVQGFMGPVSVTTSFHEDGSIRQVTLRAEGFVETPGYGQLALDGPYTTSFAGKQPPLALQQPGEPLTDSTVANLVNPDTASSATITAQAIVDAVNQAYTQMMESKDGAVAKPGFAGPVTVRVSFDEEGRITSLEVDGEGFMETPGYGQLALEPAFAERFSGKLPPLSIRQDGQEDSEHLVANLVNPDAATSATATMQAIIDAINEAFENRP